MNIYIVLIITFSIILVCSFLVFLYFMLDERKIKEVDNELLVRLGKKYTKEQFENIMFERYTSIINGIQNDSYNFLRDAVSDEEYNKILLQIKENNDHMQKEVVENIRKDFSKLISFKINNDLELAKIWISYTDSEYTVAKREIENADGDRVMQDVIIKGDKNKENKHEYILTFVKGRSNNEDILCPNCGYQTVLMLDSKCDRCGSVIVPKKMHWVLVDKKVTNLSKTTK